jgi:transposase-like protein
MEDYPRTLAEFEARFPADAACRDYLFALRWPEGFRCPRCGHAEAWPVARVRFECASCAHQASVIAGTIFQDTHRPLTEWFRAIWWVTSQKNGASALGLQRILGLGSYKTAWAWLHKLRRAMVGPGRERLSGEVEVDESYVGGLEEGTHGRRTEKKAIVAIAAEKDGDGTGRIRMRRIEDASAKELRAFVTDAVERGSLVHTDGWDGYSGLKKKGYRHKVTPVKGRKASKVLPRVHKAASLLKRWLMGTHQGAVSREHLDYYLDEFTFRFNRRTSRYRGKLFYRLLQNAVAVEPAPFQTLTRGSRGRKKRRTHKG